MKNLTEKTPQSDNRAGCAVATNSAPDAETEIASLQRRLRLAIAAAEKHHAGNIAACEREAKLRQALEDLAYWSRRRTETRVSLRDRIAAALANEKAEMREDIGRYSPGSARDGSWRIGMKMAQHDLTDNRNGNSFSE